MNSQRDTFKEKFVKDTRNMFVKAGFRKREIAIQSPTEEGPDIILTHKAEDKSEITILIQCKQAEENKEFKELNNLIRNYSSYVRQYNADVALLILGGYDAPPKFKDKREMERVRCREKVVYWDDRALTYYKITTNVLRSPYARYLILRDLGFQITIQQNPYEVDAIQLKQRPKGKKMWIFSMEPQKLLNLAYVFRRGSMDPDAYQRILKLDRLSKIGNFLLKRDSILANNIIVAFEDGVIFRDNKLHIPAKTCSAWIVDGQHRLYGFCKVKDESLEKILQRSFKLPVVGIKADRGLQGRLFTDINSKQKRINRNLLLDLYDHLDLEPEGETGILERIRIVKRLKNTDTFKGKLRILPRIEKGKITLATFVDYSKFKILVRGLGRKSYSTISDFFKSVKECFPEWDKPREFVFSTAKGSRMLISLLFRIVDYCRREDKKLNPAIMKLCLQKLKEACANEPDYFKNSNYTGKALGAGAPDVRALDLWAARIDDKLENFLSEGEKRKIGREERSTLRRLEEKLRKCLEGRLSSLTPNWWIERVPPDIRKQAEIRKRKNEKLWPWYGKEDRPLHYYINFSEYQKIIIKKDNWREAFKPIFKDETITSAKLTELEPIRNDIAHNRKLTVRQFEHLKTYAMDLISCIEAFEKKKT